MSEEMGTTTTVPTASAAGLAEQYSCTPGPWYASRKHAYVMTGNYSVIAEVRGRPEQGANAVLIAEAPAMLAALNAATGYLLNAKIDLETGCTKATAIKTIEGGLAMVRTAIAKAEGRTP